MIYLSESNKIALLFHGDMVDAHEIITVNKHSVVSVVQRSNIRQKQKIILWPELETLSVIESSRLEFTTRSCLVRTHDTSDQAQHYRKCLDIIEDSCGYTILSRAYDQTEITGRITGLFL